MESIVSLVQTQFKEFEEVPLYASFMQQASALIFNLLLEEEDPEGFVRDFFFPETEGKLVESIQNIQEAIQEKEPVSIPEFTLLSKKEKKEKSSSKKSAKNSPKIRNPLTGRDIVLGGAAFKKYQKQGYFLEDGTPTQKALDEAKLKEDAKVKTKAASKTTSKSRTSEEEDSEKTEIEEGAEELVPVSTEPVALEEKTVSPRGKPAEGVKISKILNPETGKKITKGGKIHQRLVKDKKLPASSLE